MNKLIFFCLLSLMIIYTQSTPCAEITPEDGACNGADDLAAGETCQKKSNADECEKVSRPQAEGGKTSTKSSSKTTNSSNMLNIFKITFTLLIIFTIL